MSADGDPPLPRGRHGLTREQVERSQRERVLRALAEVMAERGYAGTAVADVIRVAGVSRSTFYELFSSKDDCFMTALGLAVQTVIPAGLAARDPDADLPADPLERFGLGLRSYLDGIAAAPALARVFLVEVYAAGPEAARRRAVQMDAYAQAVAAGLLGARTDADRFAARALVASITMLVTLRLVENDTDGIRALHAPLMDHARRVAGH